MAPTASTQAMMSAGPSTPTSIPPRRKSLCSISPVEYAIAFGGVETGRKSAVEAERPITMHTSTGCAGRMLIPSGMKTALVAVLLITFDSSIVA
jgi:hypothetical protein